MMPYVGLITCLLVGYFLVRNFTWKASSWPAQSFRPPAYQGHRGFWREGAQENTLPAFAAAKARGLSMVELDVRLSQDGKAVVFHDSDLRRLAHRNNLVKACTAVELRQWAQAPTLEEVLSSPDVPHFLNIELKSTSFFHSHLEREVVAVVKKMRAESRVLFSSFNPWSLWHLSRYCPNVPRALIATEELEPGGPSYFWNLSLAPFAKIHALHLDYRYVTQEKFLYWRRRGIPVALWTVNDPAKAQEYLRLGALSIISDTLGTDSSEPTKS